MKSNENALEDFAYNDKGSMATVGRNLAVVDMPKPKLHFSGFFAWMIWMGLHLMLILGVKNRFFVFCNWLYNYFTYDQNLRLIFDQRVQDTKDETNFPELKKMKRKFLEAEWKYLIMANYAIDAAVLQPYVPAKTELDIYEGKCYVSLVAFSFTTLK